jgi:nicotinic acid mononucleotide adenylyltransferase
MLSAMASGTVTLNAAERRRRAPPGAALARMATTEAPQLELVAGTLGRDLRAGLLAGTFNPLTRAHAALAVAGHRAGCERVVLAMAPTSLDKERLERAHPVDRLDWACAWARRNPWAAVAVSSRPLLVDMAEALGRLTGGRVSLLLGTDKAAQLVEPRYYEDLDAAITRLGQTASLLVAERTGHPPARLPLEVSRLATPAWTPARSATQARQAARRRERLDDLVPSAIARAIERTGAYDDDPSRYLARARELDALVAESGRLEAPALSGGAKTARGASPS